MGEPVATESHGVPWWDWINMPTVTGMICKFAAWVWLTFLAVVFCQFEVDRSGVVGLVVLMGSITAWVIAGAAGWDDGVCE